ncbi:hypothetical protein Droror1_Dr00014893 [Drosera rotundifolia]
MEAKKRCCSEGIVVVDRLSDLTDELLGDILSFLPTKKAVHQCLSRRWNSVSSLRTSFDFHDSYKETAFRDFADRVLMMHKVFKNSFRLNYWCRDKNEFSSVNAVGIQAERRQRVIFMLCIKLV